MVYRWPWFVDAGRYQWRLARNCALTPAQLASWFVTVVIAALVVSLLCAAGGVWIILPFAVAEAVALLVAFIVYARHAADYEQIEWSDGRLVIERRHGVRVQQIECRGRVRVEYEPRAREPVRLVDGRRSIAVGRFVPDDCKPELVQQLRSVLAIGSPA